MSKFIEVQEVGSHEFETPTGHQITFAVIEEAGGLCFTVDGSYLEQEAGPLMSPYGNGECVFAENVHFAKNTGELLTPSELTQLVVI